MTSQQSRRRPLIIGLTVALSTFLVLAGTGMASAVWTAASSGLTSTVTAGSLTVTQSSSPALDATYNAANLSDTSPVTIANTGSVPATSYTAQVIAANGNNLANATTVTGWIVATTSACTPASAVPVGSPTASLTAGLSFTSTMAAGASTIFCVRTSISASYSAAPGGAASNPLVKLSYSAGSWTGSSVATATQTWTDTLAPSTPTNLAVTASSTTATLSWTASSDNVAVVTYDIYRGGSLVGSVSSPTVSFTNTGLVRNTAYSYTVIARDAARNSSAASAAAPVTTATVDNNGRYSISNPNSGLCIDAGAAGTTPANGTTLVINGCDTSRLQSWQFVATSGGNYKVVATNFATLAWDIDINNGAGANNFQKAQLWTYGAGTNQQWQVVAEGTTGKLVHFVNLNSGKCLDINGQTKTAGTQLQQYDCNGTVAQTFSLTTLP
jgi:hypothetical protein